MGYAYVEHHNVRGGGGGGENWRIICEVEDQIINEEPLNFES